MSKIVSVCLLVGGVVLIVFAVQAMNSLESDVSRFFKGTPTDKAMWMLIGGIAAAAVGAFGVFRRKG